MKKNVSLLNAPATHVNSSNVSMGGVTKVTPNQPPHGKSVYILKNTKIPGPNTNQVDFMNTSHSPRQIATTLASGPANNSGNSDMKTLTPTSGTPNLQFQLKTPRTLQSPPQKTQQGEKNKGKSARTNSDFKEASNKLGFGYLALSPENRSNQQQKTTSPNPICSPLGLPANKDKKNTKTPKSNKENIQAAPKGNVSTTNFTPIEAPTRNSNQYKPAGRENMKPDTEPSSGSNGMKKSQPASSQPASTNPESNKIAEQRVLAEIDLNSLKSTFQLVNMPKSSDQTLPTKINSNQVPNTNPSIFPQETQSETLNRDNKDLRTAPKHHAPQQPAQKPQNHPTKSPPHTCLNHPDKKAKYHTENKNDCGELEFFCSKCAIELAQKGKKVVEIKNCTDSISSNQSSSEQEVKLKAEPPSYSSNSQASAINISSNYVPIEDKNHSQPNANLPTSLDHKRRNEELVNFIQRLGDLLERINSLRNYAGHEKTKIIGLINAERESIDACCNKLIETVNRSREEIFKSLDTQQSEAAHWFDQVIKGPSKYLSEITQIKNDIEENIQNIMKNIEEKPYKHIMQKYEERFDLYERILSEKEVTLFEETSQPRTRNTIPKFKKNLNETVEKAIGALLPDHGNNGEVKQAPGDSGDYLHCDDEIKQNAANSAANRQKSFNGSMGQNYTLVSFENKDIFENALYSSKDGGLIGENSTCETVIEHDEEHAEVFGLKIAQKGFFENNSADTSNLPHTEGNEKKHNANRRSRYDESSKKENFEVLTGQTKNNKQLNEAFLNFIESKINEESSSPKGNYQKSLFTSPNFKEI